MHAGILSLIFVTKDIISILQFICCSNCFILPLQPVLYKFIHLIVQRFILFPSLTRQPEICPQFENLKSLTMRECWNQLSFLQYLMRGGGRMRLAHFKISSDYIQQETHDLHEPSIVIDLLLSLRGLNQLHLMFSNVWGTFSGVHQAIRHHQATLRSFIYHERQLLPIHDNGIFYPRRSRCDPSVDS